MIIYNTDEKFMYEILYDYKDAETKEEKEKIFNSFCSAIWSSDNKRRVTNREIRFKVKKDLLNTEIGKIFEAWSIVPYISYKQMSKNTDYVSLIRQKVNNIYTNMFDGKVCLKKEYMDLIKIPKKLYYRWKNGDEYSPDELTKIIDDAISESILVKEKYAKQKMKLPWKDYKKVVEGYFRKMFDNYICLDNYEDKTKLTLHIDTWNEDNFCIKYFCKSLDGYFKNYEKEYYGLYVPNKKNKGFRQKRCEKCGGLYQIKSKKDFSSKYCELCKKQIKKDNNKEYYQLSKSRNRHNP